MNSPNVYDVHLKFGSILEEWHREADSGYKLISRVLSHPTDFKGIESRKHYTAIVGIFVYPRFCHSNSSPFSTSGQNAKNVNIVILVCLLCTQVLNFVLLLFYLVFTKPDSVSCISSLKSDIANQEEEKR